MAELRRKALGLVSLAGKGLTAEPSVPIVEHVETDKTAYDNKDMNALDQSMQAAHDAKSRPPLARRKRHYAALYSTGARPELLYIKEDTAKELPGLGYTHVHGPFRQKDIATLFIEMYPNIACVADATKMYNKQREIELRASLRDNAEENIHKELEGKP